MELQPFERGIGGKNKGGCNDSSGEGGTMHIAFGKQS
jgi:hypothetical protein